MKTFKDEQNKKHSRISNPIRSICLTLCFTLIIGICPIYANTINVDVPGTLWSYIVKADGSIDVSSSDILSTGDNHLRWYFGRLSETIARIGNFTYQNGTYLATIYTYFSSALSDLRTYSQNTAAATNALLQLTGDQVNIDWYFVVDGVFLDKNFNQLTGAQSVFSMDPYYFKFDFVSQAQNALYKIEVPCYPGSNLRGSDYEIHFYCMNGSTLQELQSDYYYVYDNHEAMMSIYLLNVYLNNDNLYLWIKPKTSNDYYRLYTQNGIKIYTINSKSEDYIKVQNFMNIRSINRKLDDIDVNVEINDSVNVTPIDLDVSIGIEDFTAVNTISNKLRTWLTTGISVSALIGALDALDDSFFTLSNRNTIETINNQYTDFYD